MIQKINAEDLRKMEGKEGLILQGCGGDPQEWLDGINDLLTKEGILQNGTKFENIYVFQNEGITNILFPFEENVQVDIGKLAMWRLMTHSNFSGKWLSDYVDNRLGGFIRATQKPDCPLIGQDGNIFNLMGIASRTLRDHGKQTEELKQKVRETVERLIVEEGVDTFLFGSRSNFDELCHIVVTELKEKYSHIKRVYMRSQYPYVNKLYKDYLLESYDDTIMPQRVENAGKASYVERNQEMIDASDFCVFYYNPCYLPPKRKHSKRDISEYQPKSGTRLAWEYVNQRNGCDRDRVVINLF